MLFQVSKLQMNFIVCRAIEASTVVSFSSDWVNTHFPFRYLSSTSRSWKRKASVTTLSSSMSCWMRSWTLATPRPQTARFYKSELTVISSLSVSHFALPRSPLPFCCPSVIIWLSMFMNCITSGKCMCLG